MPRRWLEATYHGQEDEKVFVAVDGKDSIAYHEDSESFLPLDPQKVGEGQTYTLNETPWGSQIIVGPTRSRQLDRAYALQTQDTRGSLTLEQIQRARENTEAIRNRLDDKGLDWREAVDRLVRTAIELIPEGPARHRSLEGKLLDGLDLLRNCEK